MAERLLRGIRKAKWARNTDLRWLSAGQIQADALTDLKSTDNKISLYLVDDSDEEQKLRIAAALATTKEHLSNLDYALIDPDFLSGLGVSVEEIQGTTPDEVVNELHRDLVQLTVEQIYEIAKHIHTTQNVYRYLPNIVKSAVLDGCRNERYDYASVKLKDKANLFGIETVDIQKSPNTSLLGGETEVISQKKDIRVAWWERPIEVLARWFFSK